MEAFHNFTRTMGQIKVLFKFMMGGHGQDLTQSRRFSICTNINIMIWTCVQDLLCFLLNRQPGKHQAVGKIHLEAVNLQRDEEESIPQHRVGESL